VPEVSGCRGDRGADTETALNEVDKAPSKPTAGATSHCILHGLSCLNLVQQLLLALLDDAPAYLS
jgi:hypothetical protein